LYLFIIETHLTSEYKAMATSIEYDLKEILAKEFEQVNRQLSEIREQNKESNQKINQKLDKLTDDVADLKVGQAKLEGEVKSLDEKLTGKINALDEKLTGKINALDEKVDGLAKRIDNQEFVSRGVLVGLIVAILGSAAKMLGFIGGP
jgi:SMC interacting uncharacterized protein involved in chromosome segregation